MTVINLDDQIVGSAFDLKTRTCSYTYQHTDGSRYTIHVPLTEFVAIGLALNSRQRRRNHLATKIMNHIQTNPPDKVVNGRPSS